jgi:hydrogenase-1 operon protein HyaE
MRSPLLERLVNKQGWPVVDEASLDDFLAGGEYSLLFFTENPAQFPESNDVAVILPELLAAFADRLQGAVVAAEAEHRLHSRYPFGEWPALVLLRGTDYLGAISRVQDWQTYLAEIERLLQAEPVTQQGIGLPVVSEPAGGCH